MFKILHVMAGADAGGISTVVLNYYRYMDQTKFHFDIALTTDTVGKNAEELVKLGANIVRLPLKSEGIAEFSKELEKILITGKYNAVHVHENETSYVALRVAKKNGIPCRIAHAHTSSPYSSLKGEIRRLSGCVLNSYYATNVIACGQLAGERVFGRFNMRRKKATVLPNAIELEKYLFDNHAREIKRKELEVEDKFVVGMIGRISKEKNHSKALEIMQAFHQIVPDGIMLIAGNGEDEKNLQKRVVNGNMEDYVKLLGRREDANELYMAFDIFMLTSLHEGFPIAGVEAVASGLPVLLSDTITKELDVFDNVSYLPLGSIDKWVDRLLFNRNNKTERFDELSKLKKQGFDIVASVQKLENIYAQYVETNL
ncbi:MAG: glycosyltransferase family 1 protein [Clostridiaceae bacterium]|mgnify:CR=1 FL=1|nr:glycosyltransferase family 1 protein [Clostridiaceae bacterium]